MTKRGKTPIYGAVEKCHAHVVEWLLSRYSAAQLRANTTYGTNVVHAAAKAGNARIRDMLNAYCADYDVREARVIKAERKARHETAFGGGGGGDFGEGAPPGGEAAQHLAKLRLMAEAARRREADALAARAQRGGGAAAAHAGDADAPAANHAGAVLTAAAARRGR